MVLVLLLVVTMTLPAADKPHYVTAPRADLKQDILWGATSVSPEGFELSFGGIDQKSDDGRPHKRIKLDGAWVSIADERARRNPHQMEWMKAVKEAETITLAGKPTALVKHDGESLGGMVASVMTFPEYGLVVSVTSNISYADTFSMAVKIAEAFVEPAKSTPWRDQ